MHRVEHFTAQFDEIRAGRRRTVGVETRDLESDGSIPPHAWFQGEEFELDVEDDEGTTIYVRR
jgi:hypothetical protein